MRVATFVLPVLLASSPLAASATVPDQRQSDDPDPPGRISALVGTLEGATPFDTSLFPLGLNDLIREGDLVVTGPDAMVEIELFGATFVRLGPDSQARFERLGAAFELHLERGAAYLSTGPESRGLARDGFTSLELTPEAMGRFDRLGEHHAQARRIHGLAVLRCGDGTSALPAGTRSTCRGLDLDEAPWQESDDLDAFNEEREARVRRPAPPVLASAGDLPGGFHDLEDEGEWVEVEDRPYWRPRVADGWRPYWDGYWTWASPWGWTWIPNRPWGWVTHHYGRWTFLPGYGWVWMPGGRFAGGWVVWSSAGGYAGWAPCDFRGRPVVTVTNRRWYDTQVWTFAHKHHFTQGEPQAPASPRPRVDRTTFVTMAPQDLARLKPGPLADPRRDLAPARDPDRERGRAQRGPSAPEGLIAPRPGLPAASPGAARPSGPVAAASGPKLEGRPERREGTGEARRPDLSLRPEPPDQRVSRVMPERLEGVTPRAERPSLEPLRGRDAIDAAPPGPREAREAREASRALAPPIARDAVRPTLPSPLGRTDGWRPDRSTPTPAPTWRRDDVRGPGSAPVRTLRAPEARSSGSAEPTPKVARPTPERFTGRSAPEGSGTPAPVGRAWTAPRPQSPSGTPAPAVRSWSAPRPSSPSGTPAPAGRAWTAPRPQSPSGTPAPSGRAWSAPRPSSPNVSPPRGASPSVGRAPSVGRPSSSTWSAAPRPSTPARAAPSVRSSSGSSGSFRAPPAPSVRGSSAPKASSSTPAPRSSSSSSSSGKSGGSGKSSKSR